MSKQTPNAAVAAAGGSTVGPLFHSIAQAAPTAIALIEGERTRSYAETDARTTRLANRFSDMGLEPGSRLAVLATNCIEYVEIELAAAKAGIIIAALNWRLADRELKHCIELVSPSLVIESSALSDNLDRLHLENIPRLVLEHDLDAQVALGDANYKDRYLNPESGLVILYTSGTTGLPKGALISHRAMIARGMLFASELGIARDDHFVAWTPMFHMASTDQALAMMMRGGTVHMVDGFQPERLAEILEQYAMTWFPLIPGMVGAFNETLKARGTRPKGLKLIGAMADLVPREELAEATRLLGAPYLNTFGATETGIAPATASAIPIGEAPERLPKRQSAFCDVRLVDADDREVPVGVPGELSLAGPTLFSGYWDNDEVNRTDFRGGRFHMGDVMRRNSDGTLEYVDRVKYMIKSGGENIYPAEIEQVILADSRVESAVVVRQPDARWGEVPALFVVSRETSLSEAEIMRLCDEELSRYKRPRSVHFVSDADLPRSTTGKIQRHILEQRLHVPPH
jgi:fatty-acyl-CoA synthase